MIVTAERYQDYKTWNYLIGNFHHSRSIGLERIERLQLLNQLSDNTLKIALYDRINDKWTKWHPYYNCAATKWDKKFDYQIAYDIHRSVLENEIVIESDYPTYAQNAEAARLICKILESKGFTPHIYYSGSKSIHVHVYLDWSCLFNINIEIQNKIISIHKTANMFKKNFMEWLRAQMISCWGTSARVFDEQLIKASHLIRMELSRNKLGFKTFLGYTYKDIPPFPVLCNENNDLLPDLGDMLFSNPPQIQDIIEEYLHTKNTKQKKAKMKGKEKSLQEYFNPIPEGELKGCVKFILSEEFQKAGDGYSRAMFILYNELKKSHGESAKAEIMAWNERCGSPIRSQDIDYRFEQNGEYTFGHDSIHEFLKVLGFNNIDEICLKTQDIHKDKV